MTKIGKARDQLQPLRRREKFFGDLFHQQKSYGAHVDTPKPNCKRDFGQLQTLLANILSHFRL